MLSLNSVYSEANKDFDAFTAEGKSDPNEFFLSVTDRMISESGSRPLQFKRFCGLIENMWRIGNESAYSLAMESLIPKIRQSEIARDIFLDSITEEFRDEFSKIDTYFA